MNSIVLVGMTELSPTRPSVSLPTSLRVACVYLGFRFDLMSPFYSNDDPVSGWMTALEKCSRSCLCDKEVGMVARLESGSG